MFKLVKLLLLLAGVAGLGFLVFGVDLGGKTLYQHLVGIGRTEEAQVLGDEIEKKAGEVRRKVPELIAGKGAPGGAEDAGPLAEISADDRRALEKLLRSKKAEDQP